MKRCAVLLLAVLCAMMPLAGPAATQPRVLFAVVMARHGVRSLTHDPKGFRWLDWHPVAPGYLTAHGYRLVAEMGSFYRSYFAERGLPDACASHPPYVYADLDQRTLETARAFIEGICGRPGAIPYWHAAAVGPDAYDPLFDGADWMGPAHLIDSAASRAALEAAAPSPPSALVSQHASAYGALQQLLASRCMAGMPCPRVDAGVPTVEIKKSGLAEMTGPLTAGAGDAESLFLEQAECAPPVDDALLERAMQIHVLEYEINARNAYTPLVKGGTIFAHIVALLQRAAGEPVSGVTLPAIGRSKLVFLSGHDTQLGALGGILRVHWHPGGGIATDDMPPGSALVFALVKGGDGTPRVEVSFVSQTLRQFRSDRALPNGVRVTRVMTAPLATFTQIARALRSRGFVRDAWTAASDAPVPLAPLADPSWSRCAR